MYAVTAVKTWETWIAFLGHIFRQRMQLSQWKVGKPARRDKGVPGPGKIVDN